MHSGKKVKIGMVVAAIMGLSACASNTNYAKAVQTWQGAPEHSLYAAWGNPTTEKRLPHGGRLVTYREAESDYNTKNYSPGVAATRMSPQGNHMLSQPTAVIRHREEKFWCETSFEVNQAGVIVNTSFHGNNCLSTVEGSKKWAFNH